MLAGNDGILRFYQRNECIEYYSVIHLYFIIIYYIFNDLTMYSVFHSVFSCMPYILLTTYHYNCTSEIALLYNTI